MTENHGSIARLIRYSAKGHTGEHCESAVLRAGCGMEGDFHADGGERQLSILSAESRDWMNAQTEKGLCFSRFKENIATQGIALEKLCRGTRLAAGEAELEISGATKHCHDECPLFSVGMPCRLAGQNLFVKVIKSGEVKIGSRIAACE